ncbi:MAG: ATP-dependent Clp protease ATP-binding subunit [Clostridia bacterium]|nr:ATP-dependent Clp protease ATP-binding subunit [Clostridia bacterium]
MKLCDICKKNPAVVFISKVEGGKFENRGYCIKCVIETGVAPIEQIAEQIGVSPDDLRHMINDTDDIGISDEGIRELIGDLFKEDNANEDSDDITADEDAFSDQKTKKGKAHEKFEGVLDKFGVNLTKKAKKGELPSIIGREKEIDRAIQILSRMNKNNPVLLGAPGVGKTAVAEGIAKRIADGNVPLVLYGVQVYLLEMSNVVAGTQYRGQFESRMKQIIEAASDNVILVIDEIHTIAKAGDGEGAMNAANILKPALAKGTVKIIGATTPEEYRKYIEKDAALERRFQPIAVEEPTHEETFKILKGIRDDYEGFHNITIDDEAIIEAINLSDRYITNRFLPDKAIDIIDEAASRLNMNSPYRAEFIDVYKKSLAIDARMYEHKMKQLNKKDDANSDEEFKELALIKSDKCKMEKEYDEISDKQKQIKITVFDIASVIETWTGIPVKNITVTDKEKLLSMEKNIHKRIIGQDEAVSAVSRAIRRNRVFSLTKKRPVSFIFVGPTGVGKTELVKALAENLFGDEKDLIRVDMSEYMEKHSVSKIIGSPPGYVGYDEAGQLTERVRRHPYSVILLDEIEKAHSDVFNIFLQVLDDGVITDAQGRKIDFSNTVIIMTSNAGTSVGSASGMGFSTHDEKISSGIDKTLKEIFKPEFLNRVDEIIEFKQLTHDELLRIEDLMLAEIKENVEMRGGKFVITTEAKEIILENSYNPRYGARPIRREIQNSIENRLSELILSEDSIDSVKVKVSGKNDIICVELEK